VVDTKTQWLREKKPILSFLERGIISGPAKGANDNMFKRASISKKALKIVF